MTESQICWAIFAWIGICWLWRAGREKLRVYMENKKARLLKDPRNAMARSAGRALGESVERNLKAATTEGEYRAIQEHIKKFGPIKIRVIPPDWGKE